MLQKKEEFEQNIKLEQSLAKSNESEKELEELCQLASDLPSL